MAWVESHQEIGTHPKTKKAARLAGVSVPTMVGHLHLIWHWALDFAQEGDVSAIDPWIIEDAAMWDGEEGTLFDALVAAGFIDRDSDQCALHDWWEYAGKLIERRKADAARKRGNSGRNPQETAGSPTDEKQESSGTPTEIQRNSDGNLKESVRNLNRTVPSDSHESHSARTRARAQNDPDGFAEFWTAYPKRTNRKSAVDQWRRLKPDAALQAVIMAAIAAQQAGRQWLDGYVPEAARWLRDRRWTDEIESPRPLTPPPIIPPDPVAARRRKLDRLKRGDFEGYTENQTYRGFDGDVRLAADIAKLERELAQGAQA